MTSDNHEIKDRDLFNRIADKYFIKDVYAVSSQARKFQLLSLIELLYRKTKKENLGTVLELGCGVGANSKYLFGSYNKYIGIDYSEMFIDLANGNFADIDIEFHCVNIKDFYIRNGEIDFVFGIGILHHVDDIEKVINNLKRFGDQNTIYGFIEPQACNPIIQIMRRIRMILDKNY